MERGVPGNWHGLTLSNQLEEDVINGSLLSGTKLPPQREQADFLDISVSTLSKAFYLIPF